MVLLSFDGYQKTQSLNEIAVEINPAEVVVGEGFQNWDVNLDNIVDIFDLSIVALYYGKKVPWDYNPDVNRDSEVDLFDLVLISSHFGPVSYTHLTLPTILLV